jgi:hypothetical protein
MVLALPRQDNADRVAQAAVDASPEDTRIAKPQRRAARVTLPGDGLGPRPVDGNVSTPSCAGVGDIKPIPKLTPPASSPGVVPAPRWISETEGAFIRTAIRRLARDVKPPHTPGKSEAASRPSRSPPRFLANGKPIPEPTRVRAKRARTSGF